MDTLDFEIIFLKCHCDVYIIYHIAVSDFTTGGNGGGWPCHFPFQYMNNIYYTCSELDHTGPWCAVTEDYENDELWGNCEGQ